MMDRKLKISIVTGTRADYGIYYPLLKKLESDSNFDMNLIVTGMHLSPYYGMTIEEIKRDGFNITSTVDMLFQHSTEANMARSVGIGILGMVQAFEYNRPDFIMVLGDRGEMLSAAIAGSHMNIPVLHLHGGEVSGSIDESIRHAISKFSHIHFPATDKSADRLKKMGEEPWRIYKVGALRIDTIVNEKLPSLENVKSKYNIKFNGDYYLFVYHPVTTEVDNINNQMENIFNAILEENTPIIVIKPNSDAGNIKISNFYDRYINNSKIKFVTNFNHLDYLTILKNSYAMIGNSSSGIIEAASFKIPVINIGERQKGREQSGNVINTSYDYIEIKESLKKLKSKEFINQVKMSHNVYGDGNTAERIANVLSNIKINERLLKKRLTY